MNRENRLYGLLIAFVILVISGIFVVFTDTFTTLFMFLLGISSGYALRETLEPIKETEKE